MKSVKNWTIAILDIIMLSVWEWRYTECHYAESLGTIRGLELHKICQFKLEVVKYEAVLKKTPVKQFFLIFSFQNGNLLRVISNFQALPRLQLKLDN